jgi:hypothetical protein
MWSPSWLRSLKSSLELAPRATRRPKKSRRLNRCPRLWLEVLEDRTVPSTVTWVGGNGDWDVANNWTTGAVPGPGDDVDINVSGITITHAASTTHSVNSLKLEAGTLTGADALTVNGAFTWTGGTLAGTGSLTAQGGASITSGGTLDGRTLVIPAGTTATASDPATWGPLAVADGATIVNDGTFVDQLHRWEIGAPGGGLTFDNYGRFVRAVGGDDGTFDTTVEGVFNNYGSVEVQSGGLVFAGDNQPCVSSGTFTGDPGTRLILGDQVTTLSQGLTGDTVLIGVIPGSHTGGSYTIAGPYRANLTRVYAPVAFTGPVGDAQGNAGAWGIYGTTDLSPASGGPATLTFSSLYMQATLSGTDSFVVSGAFTWAGGALRGPQGSSLTAAGGAAISSGGTLDGRTLVIPAGTTAVLASSATASDGAVIDNYGTFDLGVADLFYGGGGPTTFNNYGAFAADSSGGPFDGVFAVFNNTGSVAVQAGLFGIDGLGLPCVSSGTFTGAAGTELDLEDQVTTLTGSVTADSVQFQSLGRGSSSYTVAGPYRANQTAVRVPVTFTGPVGDGQGHAGAWYIPSSADFSPASGGPVALTFSGLHLDGGTLSGTDSFMVNGLFNWTGGTLTGPQGSSLTATGGAAISGGTLDGRMLTNANTTTWSNGTITVVDGGVVNNLPGATFGSAGNTGTLALNGGTLAGSGTVNANVSNNGKVAPTSGGGSLVINGNYAQGSSGTLSIGLAGTAAGTSYSQLVVNGGIALSGSLAVSLSFPSAVGDPFTILHDGGPAAISGAFSGLLEGSVILVNGQRFQISYVGGTGHDVVLTHLNTPPTLANLAVTSPINEGSTATLTGNIVDPDPLDTHTLVVNWGDGSSAQTFTFGAGALPFSVSHRYLDNPAGQPNGSYAITLQMTDSNGGTGTGTASVQVNNVAPTVGVITAPVAPVQVGTAISASASFTDPGILDTHTAVWNWGDSTTSAGTVTEASGSGSVSGSHTYTTDGVFTVTLTVTDKDGASGQSVFNYVVFYNPSAGFTTGSGSIASPAGAYAVNRSLTGQANFGLNAKYHSGATVPTGNTDFRFPAANLTFQSTSYDWLVITTNQAQYQGSGTINGGGNYGFLVTALDNGGHGSDLLRLKIWDKNNNNAVVYDTQPGAATTAAPTTALGDGRIQVHTNAQLVAGGANAGGNVADLTPAELQPVVRQALSEWAAAGIAPAQLRALSQVTVGIADFPGPWLGMAFPGAIWIDPDAAGYGWSLDPVRPVSGKVDLLTVVAHELGHELGFADTPGAGLMGVFLPTGTRRLPAGLGDPEGSTGVRSLPGGNAPSPRATGLGISTPVPDADLLRWFAVPLSSAAFGMASEAPLPGPGQDTRVGYAMPTSPGVWSLTLGPSALTLAAGKHTLFAHPEDSDGVFADPLALTFQVVSLAKARPHAG